MNPEIPWNDSYFEEIPNKEISIDDTLNNKVITSAQTESYGLGKPKRKMIVGDIKSGTNK